MSTSKRAFIEQVDKGQIHKKTECPVLLRLKVAQTSFNNLKGMCYQTD